MIRVFVSGCYDILHAGHLQFFREARALGDHLTVSFASAEVLWRHKQRRSSLPDEHKRALLASLGMVDEVVVGADSGHRYVLTSRQASAERLAKVDGRSVFDLNRGHAVCVHDWVVPAAEELLELKLFLELEGHEASVSQMVADPHFVAGVG